MARSATAGSPIREQNLQALLTVLREDGPVSRADIVARTGLSTPTVSAGLRAFEAARVVREFGRITGRRGPRASLYELARDSVLALGIDIGARYLRTVLAGLDGEPVEEHSFALARPHADEVLATVRSLPDRLGDAFARVELAVAGTPGTVDPATGRVGSVPNIEGWEGILAADALGEALGVGVHVENDVNLAALGEQARGGGRGVDHFAYLSVGTGLGAGIVVDGRIHRGARGAAGEVGYVPVGPDPLDLPDRLLRGAMETQLSARAVRESAARLAGTAASSLTPPYDAEAVFGAARAGDPLGRAVARETAREIATCIAAITAVLDLELVLLGGGIGANADLLLPDVREATARLIPQPPRVEAASLDGRAVGVGAIALSLEAVEALVIERAMRQGGGLTPPSFAPIVPISK